MTGDSLDIERTMDQETARQHRIVVPCINHFLTTVEHRCSAHMPGCALLCFHAEPCSKRQCATFSFTAELCCHAACQVNGLELSV